MALDSLQPSSGGDRTGSLYRASLASRYRTDSLFKFAALGATLFGLVILAFLLFDVLSDGLPTLDWQFVSSAASRKAERAGVYVAIWGTVLVMLLTAVIAFPIGVGAGLYLEEFAADSLLSRIIEINIGNLAAVPSIIYGLLGLGFFVRVMQPITGGRSVLSGALTLALLILPVIIVATREALRSVPDSLRQAGLALGATRWQVVREQIIPLAMPGILTGTILALSRAIGETAPLIIVGAAQFITSLPKSVQDRFTVLPMQIYDWVSRPQAEFRALAASGIIVLLLILLLMNATAVFLRSRYQRSSR